MVTAGRKTWKDFALRDSAQCMQKRGGQLAEELDFILKGIKENGISMSEGVRASAIGALANVQDASPFDSSADLQ